MTGGGGDPLELSGGRVGKLRALCLVMQSGRTQYNKLDPLSFFLVVYKNIFPSKEARVHTKLRTIYL